MAGLSALPNWVKGWGTFGLGVAGGVFVAATYLSEVRTEAYRAGKASDALEPRVQRLEVEAAAAREAAQALKEKVADIGADVKELLRRVK